jgi:hypothetical protein
LFVVLLLIMGPYLSGVRASGKPGAVHLCREASLDDGRSQTLALTGQGATFVPELAALADQNEAECFSHLSKEERGVLERLLRETAKQLGLNSIPID